MQQYLLYIPFSDRLIEGGWWLPGYGAMLLLAFYVVVQWGARRSIKVGLPGPKLQDMAMALFVSGIVGARILYMIQYSDHFPDRTPLGLLKGFVSIWEGGLVVYGAVFGGFLGYLVFRKLVLKKMGINGWRLADVVAPLLAIGMAVGRLGCYLNGCCWGQVAIEDCQPVPISAAWGQFPLLPAHARSQVCLVPDSRARLPQIHGLQTSTGFALPAADPAGVSDPRIVGVLEPGSEAEKAGLKTGDVIVKVNGQPNRIILVVNGPPEDVKQASSILGAGAFSNSPGETRNGYETKEEYLAARVKLAKLPVSLVSHDSLTDLVNRWPKGVNGLDLVVMREGKEIPIAFTPKTVTFFPTQIYETISMVLLTFLLVAFQPFRRHDGQVMVLLMLGYAMHRFLNESIRIEPTYALGLTLSQWISVLIFLAGVGLELFLRKTQPRLPSGPKPLGYVPES